MRFRLLLAIGCSAMLIPLLWLSLAKWRRPLPLPVPDRVILVTLDTVRTDHLSAYGYFRETTPFLGHLAGDGVVFSNAFTSMPTTAPSHASIFTGRNPFQHGVLTNRGILDPEVPTMAQLFKSLGYQTAGFLSTTFLKRLDKSFDSLSHKQELGYRAASETVASAIDWVEQRGSSERFFLWLHLFDAHQWRVSYEWVPEYLEELAFRSPAEKERFIDFVHTNHGISEEDRKYRYKIKAIERYDAQLLFADEQLERFFHFMEDRGLNENSLWIVAGDHGEGLWSHGYIYHTKYLYDEELRVPLIFHSPEGHLAHKKIDSLVRLVDLMPTVAEIIGLPLEGRLPPLSGQSILPLIYGVEGGKSVPRYSFSQRQPKGRSTPDLEDGDVYSVQDGRFKYIYRTEGQSEFFDLENDARELANLTARPSEDRDRMRAVLGGYLSAMRSEAVRPRVNLEPEVEEELRALGYLR
jgi:arylsulfatase A-like enzyme